MKSKITLLALLALHFTALAQPIMTKSSFKTTFGDTLFTYNGSYKIPLSFPKTGMRAWDFSSYAKDPLSSYLIYENPALTPYTADFPTADYTMAFVNASTGTKIGYTYWKINNDSTWGLGGRYPGSSSFDFDYINPTCIYFPFKYGESKIDYYTNTISTLDSTKKKYVAYGSLKTPFGNFPNVILFEDYEYSSGAWVLVDYAWVDAATSLTLAAIYSDGTPYWYMSTSLKTGMQEYVKEQYQLSVYPNPSNGEFRFNYTLGTAANVGVDVLSISGQKVYSIPFTQQSAGRHHSDVNLKHLSNGIYFARITIDNKVYVDRINLEQ